MGYYLYQIYIAVGIPSRWITLDQCPSDHGKVKFCHWAHIKQYNHDRF